MQFMYLRLRLFVTAQPIEQREHIFTGFKNQAGLRRSKPIEPNHFGDRGFSINWKCVTDVLVNPISALRIQPGKGTPFHEVLFLCTVFSMQQDCRPQNGTYPRRRIDECNWYIDPRSTVTRVIKFDQGP